MSPTLRFHTAPEGHEIPTTWSIPHHQVHTNQDESITLRVQEPNQAPPRSVAMGYKNTYPIVDNGTMKLKHHAREAHDQAQHARREEVRRLQDEAYQDQLARKDGEAHHVEQAGIALQAQQCHLPAQAHQEREAH